MKRYITYMGDAHLAPKDIVEQTNINAQLIAIDGIALALVLENPRLLPEPKAGSRAYLFFIEAENEKDAHARAAGIITIAIAHRDSPLYEDIVPFVEEAKNASWLKELVGVVISDFDQNDDIMIYLPGASDQERVIYYRGDTSTIAQELLQYLLDLKITE